MTPEQAACRHGRNRSRRRYPFRGRKRTILVITLLLAVGACGGGGGVGWTPRGPNDPPPGIQGMVLLVDSDLGRISEQEPNNDRAQGYRLPPVGAGTQVEVSGEIGVTAGWFGRADPVDAFRFTCLADQRVRLTLDYLIEDPLGGGDNVVEAAVYDGATDALLGRASGPGLPHVVTVPAQAGVPLDIVVTCTNGHTPWLLKFECSAASGALAAGPGTSATTVATSALGGTARGTCSGDACSPTRLLVRLEPGADAEAVAARYGMEIEGRTGSGSLRLRVPAERAEAAGAQKMQALSGQIDGDPDVAWAEPDWRVRPCGTVDDPDFTRQWNLRVIGAPAAWDVTMGDPSIVIGIIDTGIVDHPDLEGQVVDGYDFVSDPLIGADGDIGRDPDPTDPGDRGYSHGLSSWHGTHVASIAAARANDGYGISGVAPGCRVMPIRALGVGGGLVSDVADAVLYAAGLLRTEDRHQLDEPLRIVNLSLGLDSPSAELEEACRLAEARGVLLVAAAGNGGRRGALYPARYDSVVAVTAVDPYVNTTAYSNFGNDIDLAAPGGVVSRDLPGDGWPDGVLGAVVDDTLHPVANGHNYLEGTSQACPHVAASAALLLSDDPTLTTSELRRYLFFSALDRGTPGRDDVYGRGVVQAHEALKLMRFERGNPLTSPPQLILASQTVEFHGYQTWHEVVVMNGGGETLVLQDPTVRTDSGGSWLGASNEMRKGAGPSNVVKMVITANRTQLPDEPGAYAGTVFVKISTAPSGRCASSCTCVSDSRRDSNTASWPVTRSRGASTPGRPPRRPGGTATGSPTCSLGTTR